MPGANDFEGKYVGLKLDPGGLTPELKQRLEKGERLMSGPASALIAKVYSAESGAGPFKAVGAPLSFTFLTYVPGAVTTTTLTRAVMTGPMSGCFLFKYTKDSVPYLAHVGTANNPDDAATIAVKETWKTFASTVSAVAGVSPAEAVKPDDFKKGMTKLGEAKIVAYFDVDKAYAMVLAPFGNTSIGPTMKIAKVIDLRLAPWSEVSQKKQFV